MREGKRRGGGGKINWTSHCRAGRPKKAPLSSFLLCFIDCIIALSPGQGPFSFPAQLGSLPGAGPGNTGKRQAKYGWINLQSYPPTPHALKQLFLQEILTGPSELWLGTMAGWALGWLGPSVLLLSWESELRAGSCKKVQEGSETALALRTTAW